jgi:hypothetical protein
VRLAVNGEPLGATFGVRCLSTYRPVEEPRCATVTRRSWVASSTAGRVAIDEAELVPSRVWDVHRSDAPVMPIIRASTDPVHASSVPHPEKTGPGSGQRLSQEAGESEPSARRGATRPLRILRDDGKSYATLLTRACLSC